MKYFFTLLLIAVIIIGSFFLWDKTSSVNVTNTTVQESKAANEVYKSPLGYSLQLPPSATVIEVPKDGIYAAATSIRGDFGVLCITPGYSCGGVGLQSWSQTDKNITTVDGTVLKLGVAISDEGAGDRVKIFMIGTPEPLPRLWTADAQIQFDTTKKYIETAEAILVSLNFD